jgi:hypothetical protein
MELSSRKTFTEPLACSGGQKTGYLGLFSQRTAFFKLKKLATTLDNKQSVGSLQFALLTCVLYPLIYQ